MELAEGNCHADLSAEALAEVESVAGSKGKSSEDDEIDRACKYAVISLSFFVLNNELYLVKL